MPLNGTLSRICALLLCVAAFTYAASLRAQTPKPVPAAPGFSMPPSDELPAYSPKLTFDLISIRESQPTRSLAMGVNSPPHTGRFDASSITLRILLQIAYGSGPFTISGGPAWLNDRYFRIQAKCDRSVDDQLAKLPDDQARLEKLHMLQALLAERFHLKAHWETHETSVFNLVIAKGGPKLQPTPAPTALPEAADRSAPPAATPGPNVHARGGPQGIEIDGDHFNARAITTMLASQINKPIVDKTGLTGSYSFALQFARDPANAPPDAYPGIFTAVEEQLGLKLEPSRGPADTLVIERAELPTEN